MSQKTRRQFRRHVLRLTKEALSGDEVAVRSLCCVVIAEKGLHLELPLRHANS